MNGRLRLLDGLRPFGPATPFWTLRCWVVLALFYGCEREQKLFTDVTQQVGIESINQLRPTEELNIITYLYYYNGGGVAATDINGDGLADLYFTNNQGPNKYYINEGDWRFRDATEASGLSGTGDWSNGVSVVDVNQDGRQDIYLCNVAGYRGLEGGNELYIQNQDGTFTESAAEFGLDFEGFATQAYWLDYDQDGDQDCYLLTHSVHNDATYGPANFRERPDSVAGDRLYECITTESGVFYRLVDDFGYQARPAWLKDGRGSKAGKALNENGQRPSGIYSSKIGYGLSAAIADYDKDGLPDIYVCNDFSENDYFYFNSPAAPTIFTERVREATGHTSNFSMGSTVGDFDNDGRPDLFTLDMRPADPATLRHTASADPYNVYRIKRSLGYYDQYPRNNLQWNQGEGRFAEIGQMAGVAASDWSWSALAVDFDLDGYEDIFITNGIWRRPNDLDYLKFISSENARDVTNLELADQMPDGRVANVLFRNQGDLTFKNVAEEWGLDHLGSSNGAAYADFDADGDLDLVVNNLNEPASLYRNNTRNEGGDSLNEAVVLVGADKRSAQIGMMSQSSPGQLLRPKVERMVSQEEPSIRSLIEISVRENDYADFDAESLQPYALSDEGPAVASGEVGRQNVLFIGGAHGIPLMIDENQPGVSLLTEDVAEDLLTDSIYEDVAAVFFDADGDGDDDLYVVSGGGQTNTPLKYFKDRLYLQTNGRLHRCLDCIPSELVDNGSCVAAGDFDQDGDQDLFVGGGGVPGNYGLSGYSRVLWNDGKGAFSTAKEWQVNRLGMVTDALWLADERELIVSAAWEPIYSVRWLMGNWSVKAVGPVGLWRCLSAGENGEVFAGNWGFNSGLGQPTPDQPLRLYVADLDNNGKTDPIITMVLGGRELTLADKNELTAQLPGWRKNNLSYRTFSGQDFPASFKEYRLPQPKVVTELGSGLLHKSGDDDYRFTPLDRKYQRTAINTALYNMRGNWWLGGNELKALPRVGRQDAGALMFLGEGQPPKIELKVVKAVTLNNSGGLTIIGE
ncbi:hypothetical protein CEQ90_01210 [Lewinellaceae bacterium SD302]|nr:hypothetical protein CEQ90_01210 [Lewinellaceae bacterium SD302]